MKKYFFLILLVTACTINSNVIYEPSINAEVFFCPEDMCLERIIELINNSEDIKCAFYDLDIPEFVFLLREKNAEVVVEDTNAIEGFYYGYSRNLMHNKFCVLDKNIVLTGSMNPTERGNYYNNNNVIIIKSHHLAKNYLAEFDELKNNEYGTGDKVKYPIIQSGDIAVKNYFCPEDNCKLKVINALQKANKSIYFMTYSFTDEDIGNLLWNKNYVGLDVKGIMEKRQISEYSRYEDLKEFTIIDKNRYTMHHKVFIIDNKTVITGSYNPSQNANLRNDENIIIIHDENIARKYVNEFNDLYEYKEVIPERAGNLIIHSVMYDAEGKDEGKEYVELENTGNETINLEYYFLSNNKTNSRLSGHLLPGEVIKIEPTFYLRNSEGILLLKKNHNAVDFLAWEGLWGIEAEKGNVLQRINKNIEESSWTVSK